MPRLFLLILFAFYSLASMASANELILDLDQKIDVELLPHSRYHLDTNESITLDTVKNLSNLEWSGFDKKQFGQGFISAPIWVKTTLKTTGNNKRNIALIMHQVMDHVELQVSAEGETTQYFKLGKGTPPSAHHLKGENNLNHAVIELQPNKTYSIVLGINSDNPVVGGFRAVDTGKLELEAQQQNQWILTFLLLIFLLSFYNFIIYLNTLNKAFLYHVCYVTSLICYLLNDYGYLSYWFNIYDVFILQKLTAISLVAAYLSMVVFFNSMNGGDSDSLLISRLNKILVAGGYLLLVLALLLPYVYVIRLLSAQVIVAVAVGIFISFYRGKSSNKYDKTHKRILRIILVMFAPSVLLYMLNRLGIVDTTWYTDFILFLSTFIEVVLVSLVLFIGIRQSKEAFRQELFFNSVSNLPNARALEAHFDATTSPSQQALIQIWISGLDKLEVAFGPDTYKQFITEITSQIRSRLADNPLLIPICDKSLGAFPLFHSDKNTFTLLCQPLNTSNQTQLQQQLSQSIDSIRHSHHNSIHLKVVIGAHDYSRGYSTFNTVVKKSLLALSYGIKNNKNFKYYNPQIGFDEQKRIALLNGFTESLKNDEFFLLWQPQYDTKRPKISGVEVLARWEHPQYGLVYPTEFISILEQSQRISELSRWVIGEVFEQLPDLHKKYPELEVSINLSAQDLLNEDLVNFIETLRAQYTQHFQFVTLEITETLLIDDYSTVLNTINNLKKFGFKISIDDFGSGYASFSYLQKLPANELKIDKSYTDRYTEQTTYAILETIIELAKRLNMRIVVEGIEHQQQIDLFTNLGAERLQGWILDKPMSLQSLISKT